MNRNKNKKYDIKIGRVADFLHIENFIIRYIDRSFADEETEDYSGYEAQGHIINRSEELIEDLVLDVSYYDKEGQFIGLNKTTVLEIDELEPDQVIPFKIDLDLPKFTELCVLNASARERKNLLNRFLFKGKSKKG